MYATARSAAPRLHGRRTVQRTAGLQTMTIARWSRCSRMPALKWRPRSIDGTSPPSAWPAVASRHYCSSAVSSNDLGGCLSQDRDKRPPRSYDRPMSEGLKSAYELAMERLSKKDAAEGVVPVTLTDNQKAEIATVRQTSAALLAQEEILYKSRLRDTQDFEGRQKLEEEYRRDVQRLSDDRERKIEKIRSS